MAVCKSCGTELVEVDQGRDLVTFQAAHANNINAKPCGGHASMSWGRDREDPPEQNPNFPVPCSECNRSGMNMVYKGQRRELTMFYCTMCKRESTPAKG